MRSTSRSSSVHIGCNGKIQDCGSEKRNCVWANGHAHPQLRKLSSPREPSALIISRSDATFKVQLGRYQSSSFNEQWRFGPPSGGGTRSIWWCLGREPHGSP